MRELDQLKKAYGRKVDRIINHDAPWLWAVDPSWGARVERRDPIAFRRVSSQSWKTLLERALQRPIDPGTSVWVYYGDERTGSVREIPRNLKTVLAHLILREIAPAAFNPVRAIVFDVRDAWHNERRLEIFRARKGFSFNADIEVVGSKAE